MRCIVLATVPPAITEFRKNITGISGTKPEICQLGDLSLRDQFTPKSVY